MTKQTDSPSDDDIPFLPSWFPGPLAFLAWAILALSLVKPLLPLSDQATGRHLTSGKIILEQQQIPPLDPLGYLYPDREYLNFEWLFDTGSRLILNNLGLHSLVFLAFVLFALTLCLMLRHLLDNGISLPVALGGLVLLAGANYVHLLARPVILTYFFLTLVIFLWTRVLLRKEGKSGWWLPVIFLLWANIHPGFASGLLFMGLALVGTMWDEKQWHPARFKNAWILLGSCFAVTMINPYGWKLHTLIGHQVFHSKSLSKVQEFLPPDFLHPNSAVFALAVVLISGLLLLLCRKGKLCARDLLPILIFLFFALRTQRHILLFLPVAMLPFCRMWDDFLLSFFRESWQKRRDIYTAITEQARCEGYWIAAAIIVSGTLFHLASPPNFRIGANSFTSGAEQFIRQHTELFKRPFTSTVQAGNVLFYFYPQLKVSFDDRVDFYQDEDSFAHLAAVNAENNWRDFLRDHAFDSAILYPTDPLAESLRHEPGWTEIYSDTGLIVFKKEPSPVSKPGAKSAGTN